MHTCMSRAWVYSSAFVAFLIDQLTLMLLVVGILT